MHQLLPQLNTSLLSRCIVPCFIFLTACANQQNVEEITVDATPKADLFQQVDGILTTENNCLPQNLQAVSFAVPDVWDRVRDGIVLDKHSDNDRIAKHIASYTKHPKYLDKINQQATPYIHYIVNELEKNNMPLDIALLPVVESAFDPFAYSSGFASGMWQFIPSTGKHLGLKQTWWYDGRRDVTASTRAAIEYLSMLAKHYDGDWLMALAAYNSGMGRVDRAIRSNARAGKKTDFWSLKLPKETKAYVPKLIALSRIIKAPAKYNVHWAPTPNQPYFEVVEVNKQINLKKAAELGGISMAQLRQLNPGFNRVQTDPQGPHHLLWPISKAPQLKSQLYALTNNPDDIQNFYVVKSGDSLWNIARKHQTTVRNLTKWNNLDPKGTLKVGQKLSLGSAMPMAASSNNPNYIRKVNYTVRNGDSLSRIASKFKVSVTDLKRWNKLKRTNLIRPGQYLTLYVDVSKTS